MSSTSFDVSYNPGSSFRVTSSTSATRVHPLTGELKGHSGIDYGKAEGVASILGLDVPSAASGFVKDKGYQVAPDGTGWGNYVVVEHTRIDGTKFQTLYAHLNESSPLSINQEVSAGQSVGAIGASGGADGPHLHFEVVVDGNARPLTMGGSMGKRLDGLTFKDWGGLTPHDWNG